MAHPVSRRSALAFAAAAPLSAAAAGDALRPSGSITDVPGVQVGHWTSSDRPTGCTVILTRSGAVAAVDVRGGAPGSRETDLLRPENTVQQVHGICLSGGSAYGLSTADGVMAYLEEQGIGFRVGPNVVPIVPAAILFDLGMGDGKVRPDKASGYAAAQAADAGPVPQGSVGAGTGATVGKLLGRGSMKGGLGSASLQVGDITVGAIVAVNAIGDVVHPQTGEILAGARAPDGSFADAAEQLRQGATLRPRRNEPTPGANTTIAAVAANVDWTQPQALKVAQMAHDGLARSIRPAHMPFDGDTVFSLGTGGRSVDARILGLIGALAADALSLAVVSAVFHAESKAGVPSRREVLGEEA